MKDTLRQRRFPVGPLPVAGLVVIAGCLMFFRGIQQKLQFNLQAVAAIHAMMAPGKDDPQPSVSAAFASLEQQSCHARLYEGLLAQTYEGQGQRDSIWGELLNCSSEYVHILRAQAPADPDLAQMAVRAHPENAEAWFWLAEASTPTDPRRAVDLYRQGLTIDPHNGQALCHAAKLLSDYDLSTAVDLSLECCRNGDPGGNGCDQAGWFTDRLGNPRLAIQYYRLSRWPIVQQHADELERKLAP